MDTQIKISNKNWNGYFVPKQNAKIIKEGIENNIAPFLFADGKINTSTIVNANNGFSLNAKELIPLQIVKAKNGYDSNFVGTYQTANKAHTSIKADEKGTYYNWKDKNGDFQHSAFFFAEQTESPEKFNDYAKSNLKQKYYGTDKTISVTNPSDYLASYVAACKTGAKLDVKPEVVDAFKNDMLKVCDNELKRTNAEKDASIKPLHTVLFEADTKAVEIIKQINPQKEKEQSPQQNVDHKNSQKRSSGYGR